MIRFFYIINSADFPQSEKFHLKRRFDSARYTLAYYVLGVFEAGKKQR